DRRPELFDLVVPARTQGAGRRGGAASSGGGPTKEGRNGPGGRGRTTRQSRAFALCGQHEPGPTGVGSQQRRPAPVIAGGNASFSRSRIRMVLLAAVGSSRAIDVPGTSRGGDLGCRFARRAACGEREYGSNRQGVGPGNGTGTTRTDGAHR